MKKSLDKWLEITLVPKMFFLESRWLVSRSASSRRRSRSRSLGKTRRSSSRTRRSRSRSPAAKKKKESRKSKRWFEGVLGRRRRLCLSAPTEHWILILSWILDNRNRFGIRLYSIKPPVSLWIFDRLLNNLHLVIVGCIYISLSLSMAQLDSIWRNLK